MQRFSPGPLTNLRPPHYSPVADDVNVLLAIGIEGNGASLLPCHSPDMQVRIWRFERLRSAARVAVREGSDPWLMRRLFWLP